MKRQDSVFGEDFVLCEKLRHVGSVLSLTFSELHASQGQGSVCIEK